jgi:hypothetical protein
LRIWIDLPDVPPELLEPWYEDDDLDIQLARRRELFSYFGASVATKKEAEKLAFALAASVFPAFRIRSADSPKRPGRPPAAMPKYKVEFLRQVAQAFDDTKSKVKNESTILARRIYEIFLKENPILANLLQIGGKPLTFGSFKKLLAVGRMARKHDVIWHKHTLPHCLKRSGEYVAISPVVAGVYEGLRHVEISLFTASLAERLLTLDPDSDEAKREINYLYDDTLKLLQKQQKMGVRSRLQESSAVAFDPLALMQKNGKFKADH